MVAERKARWVQFLDGTGRRRFLFQIGVPDPELGPRPLPHPDQKPARIEFAWRDYERHCARARWLDDDTLPHLNPYTGTEIFAAAFGCEVYRPNDTMPSARPLIHHAREVAAVRVPNLDHPALAILFEIADELRRRAGPHALMKVVDLQSPMDIAALIWEKGGFYTACHEAPEAVHELAAKVRALLCAFLDEWFRRYGREFLAHYPHYYMPCGITLSEDEVGAVNAAMFETLFLPELAELSQRYGGIGIHCCANARHQWAGFKRIPGLRLLNLVQPKARIQEAYRCFAGHCPQMHCWSGEGEATTWLAQHPAPERVVLQTGAQTREEAIALAAKLRALCG